MHVSIPFRWRRAIALGLVALPAWAQAADPQPYPYSAPPPARTARDIEILHGTVKVWPIYRPAPVPVVPAESKSWVRAPPAPVAPPPAPREEPKPAPVESRTIILTNFAMPYPGYQGYSPSNMPWLNPNPMPAAMPPVIVAPTPAMPVPMMPVAPAAAAPTTTAAAPPAQPTIVVIREPATDSRALPAPVTEAPHGVTIGNEALFGIGIGVAGLGFGFAGWRRRAATASETKANHNAPPAPLAADGMLLMGKYNAGPCPTSAEKFDLGPSYESQQREKKKVEEQNQQAVLEFILNQNLALHAELGGSSDDLPEAAEVDPENN